MADLHAFDPGPRRGVEQRFCCPLPACAGKSRVKTHRSLSVNTQTGEWHCHRCGASGILVEYREKRPHSNEYRPSLRNRSRADARRVFHLSPSPPPSPPPIATQTPNERWRQWLTGLQPLADSPAEAYLRGRGIDPLFPKVSGVRFHPSWYNREPAVVFPIRDVGGRLVAAQGRFLSPTPGQPKVMTAGPSRLGVFSTPEAFSQTELFITEAPIDALSLAICTFPAIALIGTNFSDWLPRACYGKRVLIATDADDPGDQAAGKLAVALARLGTPAERLKPCGAKDWNELLQSAGRQTMHDAIQDAIDANHPS